MTITPGMLATVTLNVSEKDTALAYGSGTVPVLATPRLVALVEEASVAAVADALEEGVTTVGTAVSLSHLVANRIGSTVTASATVSAVDGRRVTFDVMVEDGAGTVASGTLTRAVVDVDRFLGRAR